MEASFNWKKGHIRNREFTMKVPCMIAGRPATDDFRKQIGAVHRNLVDPKDRFAYRADLLCDRFGYRFRARHFDAAGNRAQ
jgi:hypothetical protein